MKKIIILISIILLCTSCYDYKEINDLAIISAIGIDYENDEYIITLEVLNDNIDKDSTNITSYTKTGKGKNLTNAIENATDKLSKQPIFNHIKLMILSKNIIENKFSNIIDLFLRNTYFRENFLVTSSLNTSPETLLKTTPKDSKVASNQIINILNNASYSSNANIIKTYDEIINELLTFGIDTCFSNIELNNDEIIIDGAVIFNDYKYISNISNEYVKIYNILTNNFDRPTYTKEYNDKSFTITVNNGKTNTKINNNKIVIEGNLMGRIIDNDPNIDIRNTTKLEKIDKDFTNIINEKINEFIKYLQENNSDVLGLTKKYYQNTRIKNKDIWKTFNIKPNINFYINKKGLIYNIKEDK